MPRVRLRIQEAEIREDFVLRYTEPKRPGEAFVFPVLRLTTTVTAGSRLQFRAAIDTGAWISIITHDAWTQLDRQGLIEFLPPPNGVPTPRAVIAGARSEFRLGRIHLGLIDRDDPNGPRLLPPVPVIAQMLIDPTVRLPFPVLLGLHGGILDGRLLRREPVLGYEASGDSMRGRADAGRRFGQEWYLEV